VSSVPAVITPSPSGDALAAAAIEPRQLGLIGRIVVGLVVAAGVAAATPSGVGLLWFVPYAGVGALLVVRRPRTSIGWLLLSVAFLSLPLFLGDVAEPPASFSNGTVPPTTAVYVLIHAAGGVVAFVVFSALAMVFPSGRFPGGRWGRVGRAAVVVELLCVALAAVSPTIWTVARRPAICVGSRIDTAAARTPGIVDALSISWRNNCRESPEKPPRK